MALTWFACWFVFMWLMYSLCHVFCENSVNCGVVICLTQLLAEINVWKCFRNVSSCLSFPIWEFSVTSQALSGARTDNIWLTRLLTLLLHNEHYASGPCWLLWAATVTRDVNPQEKYPCPHGIVDLVFRSNTEKCRCWHMCQQSGFWPMTIFSHITFCHTHFRGKTEFSHGDCCFAMCAETLSTV